MLQHPEYVLIGSDADYITQTGEFIFSYTSTGHTNEEIKKRILERNPFIHSVVFFPKDVAVQSGGYDRDAHTFEDHLLWQKVIKLGKVCNFKKPLIKVRLNPESVTTDERLRGKRFLEIRQHILQSNESITESDEKELSAIIKSQNSILIKKLGYHMFIAKKFLWNNYKPKAARKHIIEAVKLKPLELSSYLLLIISFLPEKIIAILYKSMK